MESGGEKSPFLERKLSRSTKFAYALGHIFNDLTAAMWFSYTLIYLQRVALLEPIVAGILLLLGQIVDALMTPVFGFLVDRYCQKKTWHVAGSVMVALTFPAIFGGFASSVRTSYTAALIVYVGSITVFQIGWAAVQISHLSMIPSLAGSSLARADLTAIRYSAQVSAAVLVFVVTWIVLPATEETMVRLDEQDVGKFRNIILILVATGITTSVLFHLFLKAGHLNGANDSGKSNFDETKSSCYEGCSRNNRRPWLAGTSGTTFLLRTAMLYVASRLFITLATVYLPLYIEESNIDGKQALATVPLVSYLSSFVAALLLKYLNKSCGTKVCYFLGALVGILSAAVTEFGGHSETVIYTAATLIGAAGSITMVTALSVTAELIGSRTERSAIVYSIVTFLDKVITGLVVVGIEKWRCDAPQLCPHYNRDTLSVVCLSSMLLGIFTLFSVSRCIN